MATHATKTAVSKPSFASIAAMAPPTTNVRPHVGKENVNSLSVSPSRLGKITAVESPSAQQLHREANSLSTSSPTRPGTTAAIESPSAQKLHRELHSSMARLAVKDPALVSDLSYEQQKSSVSLAGFRSDDDRTQVSSSSTKPASLDGKSTTSGTTFALDEKESLRPDDSASVKAAEDDEFGSGPASGAQNSRVGSEAGSRAFRDQFHEITENISSSAHRILPPSRRVIVGIEEESPGLTQSPQVSALQAPVNIPPPPQVVDANGPTVDYRLQEPDEKLLEALESPKDRLFLLRLEQEVITFIRDATNPPMLDLPPFNSFCRLLAHKLADYYALNHRVDNAVSSVRLYRTPSCQLRPPLSALVSAPAPIDVMSSSQPAMKIMRRAGLGKDVQTSNSGANTTDGSKAPSKAGSESGYDSQQGTGVVSPADSAMAKEKSTLTREEREAKYKETRERIFGPETESTESSEAVPELSRTSSRNEKKKKRSKNNDDGFTARSQFNVYYPSMPFPTATYDQNGSSSTYFNPYAMQPQGTMSQTDFMNTAMLQQNYPSMGNAQAFSSALTSNPMLNGYDVQTMAGYNQQTSQHYYPQMQQGMGLGIEQPSPALSNSGQFPGVHPQLSEQQWPQNNYPYPYQQSREQQQYLPPQTQHQSPMAGIQSVPYQYGQLPVQQGVHGSKSQHPLPGSYKSQSFNPQTRAFIPNNGSAHPQAMHQGNSANPSLARSPAMSLQNGTHSLGYGQQAPLYPPMASLPVTAAQSFSNESKSQGTRKSSTQSNATQSPAQSSLSKWGTPAHLPPKPPPPETPSAPEGQHSLPLNNQFNANVQPMNGGQPMPSFQNGVYSMPGANPHPT